MDNKKPTIGFLVNLGENCVYEQRECFYRSAVEKSGGVPLVLPYCDGAELDRFVEECDGFFFTGGADVAPERYGEARSDACGEVEMKRDDLEFRAFEKIIKTEKPILGVCRGMQLINVALGGTLYQDIPSEIETEIAHRQKEDKTLPSHEVAVLPNTPIFDLFGKDRATANSFHHQCVKSLGKGLLPMAKADDGIIEAVYLDGSRYLRAYQWHPERLCEQNRENRLVFDDFIKACLL